MIQLNGQTIKVPDGASISIVNGEVFVNGACITTTDAKIFVINGNPGDVRTDKGSVEVKGSVAGSVSAGSSVSCNNVGRSVTAGSSVSCDDVGGDVIAGSSVNCDNIRGNCSAKMVNRG